MNDQSYGGYSDWRLPSIGEVEEALANGLQSHLDHFLDGSPDDGEYRWSSCTKKIRGANSRYAIRFADSDVVAVPNSSELFGIVCVRGLPSDNDCPGKKGGGKDKNALLMPRSTTGAILLLPLGLVIAARCLRRRP